ncbi:MAG TPA: 50S ribosomal protein L11 methyltransferase [Beijerinckiaceae bacterium]|nr:50S ribosomal protein L11 methyltransferase [Beijerinckiaceae bacterium]
MLEGLPPNNAAHVMRLRCDEVMARRIADLMVETFDPAEVAAAAFEESANVRDWSSGPWIVEVYFGYAPDEDVVRELVGVVAGAEECANIVFGAVTQKDWISSSLEGLRPVRAGRFLVHGSHDRDRVASNDLALEIEASLAFGTGHHGTTRGCLILLDRLLKRRRPNRVLDVGCGSGVLALAAAKALRMPVACGDIDPVAVAAARSNAQLNGLAGFVRPVVARGVEHPALRGSAPYDLIFGNILAEPLRRLAPGLCGLASANADLILSGLLGRDVPGVLSAYAAQSFFLAERLDLEGWASLRLRRSGASPRALRVRDAAVCLRCAARLV